LQRSQLLVKSGTKWHKVSPVDDFDEQDIEDNQYWVEKLEKFAEKLYENEKANFAKASKANTEKQWLSTVLKSGVLTDKLSAYAVLLQENPVQNLSALESLISMVNLKSRRPCMMSLDTLPTLFTESLLPGDRKLRNFNEQPLKRLNDLCSGNKDTRDKYLILWIFEAKLKAAYKTFLQNLADVSKDTIEKTRVKVMVILQMLLIGSPEQEQELLTRLINKLGDPVRACSQGYPSDHKIA